jgi:hypothetical protein
MAVLLIQRYAKEEITEENTFKRSWFIGVSIKFEVFRLDSPPGPLSIHREGVP